MSNKNEVFEYLIDQLRQQLPVVDVIGEIKRWSIDRSIAGRGNYTDEENAIIDAYIGLGHNPYKQQCEDLAHEVQSLKSELARYKKPYIAYVKKTDWVQGDSRFLKKWGKHRADILRECIQEQDAELHSLKNQLRDASEQIKELHLALVKATGDVEVYKLIRKGGHGPEQSGRRKGDTQECHHNWRFGNGKAPAVCINCGVAKPSECEHKWQFYGVGFPCMCLKCGLKK